MPFRFAYVCDLLEKLHRIHARHPPYLPRDLRAFSTKIVTLWFKKHEYRIKNEADCLLLLSIILAESQHDRDYGLCAKTLAMVIGRAFALPTAQFQRLVSEVLDGNTVGLAYRVDLGYRVEQVTSQRVRYSNPAIALMSNLHVAGSSNAQSSCLHSHH